MLTLSLQLINAVAALLFGLLALRVSRRLSASGDDQHGTWFVTGLCFTLLAAIRLPHAAAAAWAFFSEPGSAVYSAFLRWSPAANHAGSFVMFAMSGMVLVFARWRPPARPWPLMLVLIGSLSLGAAVGLAEGPLVSEGVHWMRRAGLDLVGLILLGVVLLYCFGADTVDRYLWLCLAAYGFQHSISASFFSVLAWVEVPGVRIPAPWMMQAYRLATYTVIIALVLRRLTLTGRQVPVPSMLETLDPRRVSTLGLRG